MSTPKKQAWNTEILTESILDFSFRPRPQAFNQHPRTKQKEQDAVFLSSSFSPVKRDTVLKIFLPQPATHLS